MFFEKLKQAFESELFGQALSLNLLAIMKKDLVKCIRAFPITTYVGEPGVGKTTLVDACLICDYERLCFSERPKFVENIMNTTEKKLVFLDDLADYKAQGIREKGFKNVDGVVRKSYEGIGPLIILTAERKALMRQAVSCVQRMMCINADFTLVGYNREILEWLQKNKEKLQKIIGDFATWYTCTKYDFDELLRQYRNAFLSEGTPRKIDLVFSYYISMTVFSDFLKSQNGVIIDKERIHQNMKKMFCATIENNNESIIDIRKIFDLAVQERRFVSQFIRQQSLCKRYLQGKCSSFGFNCDITCSEESQFDKEEWLDPQDLITNFDEGFNSVLIKDIHWIKGCPKHILHEPVLIIDSETLKCIINDLLLKDSITKKMAIPEWSDIAIHKKLYENRQCFYLPNGLNSCRYTMNYRCFCNDEVVSLRVCILRLTQEQFDNLVEQSLSYKTPYNNYHTKDIHGMIRVLNNFIGNLQYTPGEIGKSIYEEVK